MDYGIGIPSYIDAWREVKAAEEAGFTHAWFYDSQLIYSDVWATMALAAQNTKSCHTEQSIGSGYGSGGGVNQQDCSRSGDCRTRYWLYGAQHNGTSPLNHEAICRICPPS